MMQNQSTLSHGAIPQERFQKMTGETSWARESSYWHVEVAGSRPHNAECFASYQRAFIDFFEDQLVAHGYDWKQLLEHYLYDGDAPLINSLVSGCKFFLEHQCFAIADSEF